MEPAFDFGGIGTLEKEFDRFFEIGRGRFDCFALTGYIQFRAERGGSGTSDSVVSGSLASPKPPSGGASEERGNEANTTKSRSNL
jgi:hypothetical protein